MSLISIVGFCLITLMAGGELKKWLKTRNSDSLALIFIDLLFLGLVVLNEILNHISLVVIGG